VNKKLFFTKSVLFLLFPGILYIAVAVFWHMHDIYHVTGDEPHYLIITHSLVYDHDLLLTNNYQSSYWAADQPYHTVGEYSIHNIGLPLLLVVPYKLAGMAGGRVFMAIVAMCFPLLFYRVLVSVTGSHLWSILVAATVATGLPFLAAANQIYPDLIGGLLILYAAERITTANNNPSTVFSPWVCLNLGFSIAFLPWLHLRLSLPAVILLLAHLYIVIANTNVSYRLWLARTFWWLIPLVLFTISVALLAIYNTVAFQNPAGPYGHGALTFNPREFLMIFLGLHWDQSQGMFLQHPLLLLGLVGLVPMIKANRTNWRVLFLISLLSISVLLPNSMHPAWYGAWAFAGRFHWSIVSLLIFPLAYAIRLLLEKNNRIVLFLCISSILLQVWLATRWFSQDSFLLCVKSLYASPEHLFIIQLLPYYKSIANFLVDWVAFVNFESYLANPINYVFLIFGLVLVITGWLLTDNRNYLLKKLWIGMILIAVVVVLFIPPGPWIIQAQELTGQVGQVNGTVRTANKTENGFLIYGPYVKLPVNNYEIILEYESDSEWSNVWDITFGLEDFNVFLRGAILPSSRTNGEFRQLISINNTNMLSQKEFQFRVYSQGSDITIKKLHIVPLCPVFGCW
jgi:hypothetical protein